MCKLFRCSILQLPKQNKALLWWDDAHAEESGEATAIAEERKNGRVLRANGGIRFSNVIDFDWPQKFQDIDIEYVSHFRDHFLGNCLFLCQTLKSRIKQAYFPAPDDWYHQRRVYPFVICISNWFWDAHTDQTNTYTWDLILCPHIGTCVAGMPWCSSNMVLTSRYTQHTKRTWPMAGHPIETSGFFLSLWPERGALPSFLCPLKQFKVPRFLWCSSAFCSWKQKLNNFLAWFISDRCWWRRGCSGTKNHFIWKQSTTTTTSPSYAGLPWSTTMYRVCS